MKKLLTAMLALLMLVGIIAIPAMAEDDDIYIAMFPKGYTGDFWKSVEMCIRDSLSTTRKWSGIAKSAICGNRA